MCVYVRECTPLYGSDVFTHGGGGRRRRHRRTGEGAIEIAKCRRGRTRVSNQLKRSITRHVRIVRYHYNVRSSRPRADLAIGFLPRSWRRHARFAYYYRYCCCGTIRAVRDHGRGAHGIKTVARVTFHTAAVQLLAAFVFIFSFETVRLAPSNERRRFFIRFVCSKPSSIIRPSIKLSPTFDYLLIAVAYAAMVLRTNCWLSFPKLLIVRRAPSNELVLGRCVASKKHRVHSNVTRVGRN